MLPIGLVILGHKSKKTLFIKLSLISSNFLPICPHFHIHPEDIRSFSVPYIYIYIKYIMLFSLLLSRVCTDMFIDADKCNVLKQFFEC